ncbi:hypothetical protein FDP41_009853 [Naegleria fowleri]|uniref:Uncharacterized protein n=1 Tax=Naegleria fowleri TaxID=5763 RepID=A0A6A5BBZ3_NAEFO|nr:uncharacterized protein FDP41_009853 [Naegleria fowleri]KAF0971630.1 hypothetical protein FDP41_009853 [Naegleria fowleri]CAG4711839.1 unnamed protein product [Naegleria fowleri]
MLVQTLPYSSSSTSTITAVDTNLPSSQMITTTTPTSIPTIFSKAPKGSLQSFYMLLGALDYINDAQEYPRLSTRMPKAMSSYSNSLLQQGEDEEQEEDHVIDEEEQEIIKKPTLSSTRRTRRTSRRRTYHLDEDYVEEDNEEDASAELDVADDDSEWSEEEETSTTTATPRSSSNSSQSRAGNPSSSASSSNKIQHVNSEGLQTCACCKRDSTVVSFLKNYSIHQGNIHNYRNCFPEYDVVPGISCMTCYHKQWRYTKGLYDPNKARNGAVNKREGIQRGGNKNKSSQNASDAQSTNSSSSSTNSTSSKRKRSSSASNSQTSQKRKKGTEDVNQEGTMTTHNNEEMNHLRDDTSSTSSSSKKPRKLAKRKKETVNDEFVTATSNSISIHQTSNVIEMMPPNSNKFVDASVDVARTIPTPQEYGFPSTSTSGMMMMTPPVAHHSQYQF